MRQRKSSRIDTHLPLGPYTPGQRRGGGERKHLLNVPSQKGLPLGFATRVREIWPFCPASEKAPHYYGGGVEAAAPLACRSHERRSKDPTPERPLQEGGSSLRRLLTRPPRPKRSRTTPTKTRRASGLPPPSACRARLGPRWPTAPCAPGGDVTFAGAGRPPGGGDAARGPGARLTPCASSQPPRRERGCPPGCASPGRRSRGPR